MKLNINTSMEFTKQRADKTRAVQASIATGGGWVWPLKTVAQWEADLAQLEGGVAGTIAQKALAADAAYTVKRTALETRYKTMKAKTLQAVGVMRARALQNADLRDSVDELSSRAESFTGIEEEGEEMLAVWKEDFGTAFSVAPGNSYAEFESLFIGAAGPPAVPTLRTLKVQHKDARVLARKEAGKLAALINRLDDETIAWYKEATAVYPAGTDEGDLIRSEVPTIDDYNPPTGGGSTGGGGGGGGGSTPPPAAPQNVVLVEGAAGSGEIGLNADPVDGAVDYVLRNGGSEVATSATLPVMFTTTTGEAVSLSLIARNAGGDSDPSDTLPGTAP